MGKKCKGNVPFSYCMYYTIVFRDKDSQNLNGMNSIEISFLQIEMFMITISMGCISQLYFLPDHSLCVSSFIVVYVLLLTWWDIKIFSLHAVQGLGSRFLFYI